MGIKIFITGGTFDKEYDELTGRLLFRGSQLESMLQMGRCHLPIEIEVIMLKDSLEFTHEDRAVILDRCERATERHLVITHGTDTMEITACYLMERMKAKDKVVVLTGAMIPIRFGSSDGLFNLGGALAFAQVLPAGVYIAMNGRWFHGDNVRKNKTTGRFEALT